MANAIQRRIVEASWKTEQARARYCGALMPPVYWRKEWLIEALATARREGVKAGIEAAAQLVEARGRELKAGSYGVGTGYVNTAGSIRSLNAEQIAREAQ